MGTVKEICLSTKFRHRHNLSDRGTEPLHILHDTPKQHRRQTAYSAYCRHDAEKSTQVAINKPNGRYKYKTVDSERSSLLGDCECSQYLNVDCGCCDFKNDSKCSDYKNGDSNCSNFKKEDSNCSNSNNKDSNCSKLKNGDSNCSKFKNGDSECSKFKNEDTECIDHKMELKRGSELSHSLVLARAESSQRKSKASSRVKTSAKSCCTSDPNKLSCDACCPQSGKTKRTDVSPPGQAKRTDISSSVHRVKSNCCACCGLLADYLKEVARLMQLQRDTRVTELFCQLCAVAAALCSDCLHLFKNFISALISRKQ